MLLIPCVLRVWALGIIDRVYNLVITLTCCVSLGELLHLFCPNVLIYKTVIINISTLIKFMYYMS